LHQSEILKKLSIISHQNSIQTSMQSSFLKKAFSYLLVLLIGVWVGYLIPKNDEATSIGSGTNPTQEGFDHTSTKKNQPISKESTLHDAAPDEELQQADSPSFNPGSSSKINKEVPTKVYKVLSYIQQHGTAPEGYVGGRRFKNLEKLLPQQSSNHARLAYQEWDVNPKIEGRNRGRERLVTDSEGNAYFTADHYQSFTKIEPK
jgi:ribonuclease T1